jgi:hypothetical protein
LNNEINDYIHDLNRTLKLQGMDVKNLAPQVADPSKTVEVLITLIAGARNIPKRILVGAERGELGGNRDENAWTKKVRERQTNHCIPMMVRPFIDRLMELGVLPPSEDYKVVFPDISVPTEEEEAKVAETKAKTLAVYSNSMGAQEVMPPDVFLKEVMGFDDEIIEKIDEQLGEMMENDLEDEEKEAKIRKEIEDSLIKEGKNKIARDKALADITQQGQMEE